MKVLCRLASALLIALAPAVVSAQSTSPTSRASAPGKVATPSKAATASPEVAATVERLYLEGAALYRARKYRLAVERFTKAYQLFPEPNLLYNVGRCHEALGQVEQAMKVYKTFIAHPQADSSTKAKAKAKLGVLEKAAAAAAAATSAPAPADTAKPVARPALVPSTPKPHQPSRFLRVSKWVIGGIGVAAAGAATALFLMGKADHDEVEDAKGRAAPVIPMSRVEAQALKDSGDTKKLVGVILWGVAGAAIISSALLFIFDRGGEKAEAKDSSPTLSASPLPGGASVGFSVTF
ncbi:MAG: hypothetical protein CSA65_06265 [Proteobacteria bacterium]|nr:MAG: hypothetical protein CSA65_06265 [Pseudomonadota bacterium]